MAFEETKPRQSQQYASADFFFRMGDHFSAAALEVLQDFFAAHQLAEEFKWLPDGDNGSTTGKVCIRIGYDENERFLPRVELSTVTGGTKNWGLGRNLMRYEDGGNKYIRKGGRFDGDIQYNVCARNLEECKRLADIVLLGLSYPMEYELYRRSVCLVPDSCKIGAPQERTDTDQTRYYSILISVSGFSTWFQDFKIIAPEFEDFDVRVGIRIDVGTITNYDATSLTDDTKSWIPNGMMHYIVQLLNENNVVTQEKKVTSNTNNRLYIEGTWQVDPTIGTKYQIISKSF